ncbi:glycosyltransferase family 4 protein, partial [Nocardioides terrae]|uniref:glycosyltransferase family 4 protein n=1 Tax=Nocardioides terrae TaxID=574651 RepID=UPI000B867B41
DDQQRAAAEIWLPTDLAHGQRPLCRELESRGATVRHIDLPILRRSHRTPRHLLALLHRVMSLMSVLRATNADTVYCTTSAAFLVAPIARLCGVPHVLGHVQEIWKGNDRRILGLLAFACHRLLAISEAVAISVGPRLRSRVTVVPNASVGPADPWPLDGRRGPLTFLVASRWNAWKGHQTLLAAWGLAGCPGRLVILGGMPPTGEATDVEALRAKLPDPDSVDVVGEVEDVEPYLRDADVMVVPSDHPEPFGLVATEAFAQGRPVIASAGGGLLDIVTDGSDGWLYPLADAQALAAVLTSLDRRAVTAAGAQARRTYLKRFTPEHFAVHWRSAFGSRAAQAAAAATRA